jgi:aspartate/methionine/tyrosine aminotransferase
VGSPTLREEIAKLYLSISKDQVFVTAGAQEAIFLFFKGLFEEGDGIVVHYPCYQSLTEVAESIGCNVIKWVTKEEENWELDVEFLATTLALYNSPQGHPSQVLSPSYFMPHPPSE